MLPTTDRLSLRRFTESDLDLLVALYGDERVARMIGGVKTPSQCAEMLRERILKYYDDNPGLGVWVTTIVATGERIGMHLLNHIQGETYIQVGYSLLPSHWGKGYATEMAEAVVRYGYTDLALPQIVAITNLDNVGSQQVLTKIGLVRDGERAFAHPAYVEAGPLAWFVSEREPWLASARA